MRREPHSNPETHSGKQKMILLALLVLVLGSVFLLPKYVSEPWLAGDPDQQVKPVATPASEVSPSTAAEKTRYRQESQGVLAEIIAVRDRLLDQQVDLWAEIDFNQALAKVESGDQQYSYGEYRQSLGNYQQALTELNALEELGQQKLAAALTSGEQAVEELNQVVATTSSDLATAIAPGRQDVRELASRVANLPQLAAMLESADQARADGDLVVARTGYQQAVSLDPAHQRAATSLSSIKIEITDSVFRGHMSRGYAFLDNNDFALAQEAFREAGKVYPGRAAVSRALAQVDNRKSHLHVSQQVQQAAELESAEQWQQAVLIYQSLLAQDPSLTDARVRLIPAKTRAELDARLEKAMEDPLKLAESNVYRRAVATLADARGIPNPGARLNSQIDSLDEMLRLAVSPVEVVFQSDSLTRVTLFRVAELGLFEQTSLQLKPGRYIAGGTRQGFRDVRIEFTITGKPLDAPIVVRCMEQI
jgi:tetratricopeptide (TPR) repeat protein